MCSHAKINVVMNIRELFNQSAYHLHQNLQLKKHVLLMKKMYVFNHEGQNQEQSSTTLKTIDFSRNLSFF
jgi:hypothetical protein